jgi:hypothetical protein
MSKDKIKEVSQMLTDAHQKLKTFAETEGKQAIASALKEVFDSNLDIVQIQWTQYTPFFNDGDICEFGVNEPAVFLTSDDPDGSHWDHNLPSQIYDHPESEPLDSWKRKNNERYQRIGKNTLELFRSIWRSIPSELMKLVFGDHVKVTVTRDSIETEEYSHD